MKKTLLIAAFAALTLGAFAQDVLTPTVDGWIRQNNENASNYDGNKLEVANYANAEDATQDYQFWGVMQFNVAKQAGMRVKDATLRLVTERVKADREMAIYLLNTTLTAGANYGSMKEAVDNALQSTPIATFTVNGQDDKSVDADASKLGDDYLDISAWTNNIALDVEAINALMTNNVSLLIVAVNANGRKQSTCFFTTERTDGLILNEVAVEASALVPQLAVNFEEDASTLVKTATAAVDGWVMDGWQSYNGEIELKNQVYNDNETEKIDRFYGVLRFDIPTTPAGKKLTRASLRLVTERVKNNRTTDVYLLDTEIADGKTYGDMADAITAALAGDKLATFDMVGNNNSIRIDNQTADEYMTIEGWTNNITLDVEKFADLTTLNLLLDAPVVRDSKNDSNRFFTSEATDFTNENINLTVTADKLVPQLTLVYEDTDEPGGGDIPGGGDEPGGDEPGGDEPGGETGISTVSQSAANSVVYTLSGQRVSKATRGFFIINGKKIVNK